jgi:hypothetical protein
VGTAPSGGVRRSWTELWWVFAIAILAFGAEWLFRRSLGAP